MAVAGLVLGYLSLLVTAGVCVALFSSCSIPPSPLAPIMMPPAWNDFDPASRLGRAFERLTLSSGNSDTATTLAPHLLASLHDISQQLQVGSLTVSDGNVAVASAADSALIAAELSEPLGSLELQQALAESVVDCAREDDACAFLVRIENLKNSMTETAACCHR